MLFGAILDVKCCFNSSDSQMFAHCIASVFSVFEMYKVPVTHGDQLFL